MCNISVKTKENFFFGGAKVGKIKMSITQITNIPSEDKYHLTIVDSCVNDYTEEIPEVDDNNEVIGSKKVVKENVLGKIERNLEFTYDELNRLSSALKLDRKKFNSETDFINEMFRQGLYIVTVQECQAGLLGEAGKGRYQTTAKDWEIVRN